MGFVFRTDEAVQNDEGRQFLVRLAAVGNMQDAGELQSVRVKGKGLLHGSPDGMVRFA